MTDKKGWGATVAGWFVERNEEDQPVAMDYTADDSSLSSEQPATSISGSAEYAQPSPTQAVFQTPPPVAMGGQVDFEAVFGSAGVGAEERARVAKTIELLHSLPADTDAGVKKQIVEAALKAKPACRKSRHWTATCETARQTMKS